MTEETTYARMKRHINGRWEDMDEGTRSGLTTLAEAIDDLGAAMRAESERTRATVRNMRNVIAGAAGGLMVLIAGRELYPIIAVIG